MKAIVVDFDGTLVRKNSFPGWIIFALKKSLTSFKPSIFFALLILLVKRKFVKNINHLEFKQRIDAIHYPAGWGQEFLHRLRQSRSEKVSHAISAIRAPASSFLVISTAAPKCYAQYIPDIFFPMREIHCLYSQASSGNEYFNNFQGNKVKSLEKILKKEAGFILFSDHADDYELAKKSERFYLCNPRQMDQQFFDKAGIAYILLQDK